MKNFKRHFLASACVVLLLMNGSLIQAADHADAPLVSHDQATDIGDSYFFLDPNDNGRAILAMDVHGFITPGENGNMGFFDPDVNFRFQIENTGDAKGDTFIDISFSEQTSRSEPQTATINMFDKPRQGRGIQFTALTTVSSAASPNAPAPVLTTDLNSGITFFAGLRDDPFFFDIPGFVRFLASVRAGSPNVGVLSRGRDSFAGYNINMIVLSVPVSLLQGSTGKIGLAVFTQRSTVTKRSEKRDDKNIGKFVNVDRFGVPAVNIVFVPFSRKDEYNRASTEDDADGKFAADIVATLQSLGTSNEIIGILAGLAVSRGDMLRLDLSVRNTGGGGGNNPEAAFPNGRRPVDDVIDTLLFFVTNRGLTTGDHVNANDLPFLDTFPFFAAPVQPFDPGTTDDRTRN